MSLTLIRNYINFIKKVRNSPKQVLRQLYSVSKADVRSTTGSNLRNIILLTDLTNIDDLQPSTVDKIKYKEMLDRDKWRIPLIKEVMDMKHGNTIPEGWIQEEMDEILEFACTE